MLLNVHTSYSLLQSTLTIDAYIERAKRLNYQRIGIADINVLHGVVEFYQKAKENQLIPLIGMTLRHKGYFMQDQTFDLVLYAKDFRGYQELIHLSKILSKGEDQNIWQQLNHAKAHLVAIICGKVSELGQAILRQEDNIARQLLSQYIHFFGRENLYMGLSAYPYQQNEIEHLAKFANEHQLAIVLNQLVNSLTSEDAFSLKVLEAIAANEQLDISIRHIQGANYLYPLNELATMYELAQVPQVIKNTEILCQQLSFDLPLNQVFLPKYPVPNGYDAASYLKFLINNALEEKDLSDKLEYIERANYELTTIHQMGFSDYFLIVWEILDFCRKEHIRVGPGRGSAAGSLVSYLLNITLVDPIQHDLLFERFLNPERYNMPDIDVDVPDNQRDRVLKHIESVYGHNKVAQIGTMGTFGAKQAIRDTLRVLGFSTEEMKRWSNAIPRELNITLKQAYQQSVKLQAIVNQTKESKQVFQVALTLEGLPRHISTHAAAVVIHDEAIETIIPVLDRPEQMLLTQLTMYDVERVGLLKMDILGLRNLSLLEDILTNVKISFGKVIDVEQIPMNDDATLALFRSGETNGVFQFESDGIKQVLKRLSPTVFEEIVAVNALYRPGPMKQIDEFIKRKKGQVIVSYLHPILEPILSSTYGIIVYQEQVMQICQQMAGFTLGQADLLRRAMGKKQVEVMQKERQHFVEGALHNGIDQQVAEQVFDYILAFASYGFNKSHAVVYSTLAYQLAYLKVHYPLAFYQAVLNQGRSNLNSFIDYIEEAKRVLGELLPLSINHSFAGVSIEGNRLRIGFESVKGLRRELIQHLLNDRQQFGPYTDILSFLSRLPKKYLKQEWIEALIKVGAFSELGYNRATLSKNIDNFIKSIEFSGMNFDLFQEVEPKIEWEKEWDNHYISEIERELLGFTLAPHPLQQYQRMIDKMDPLDFLASWPVRKKVKTIIYIQSIRMIQTKKQEPMAFLTADTGKGMYSLVVFPNIFQRYQYLIRQFAILLVEGTVDINQRGEKQLIVNRLAPIEEQSSESMNSPQQCFIRMAINQDYQDAYQALLTIIDENPGPCKVILVGPNKETWQLDQHYQISYSNKAVQLLTEMFGDKNVIYR